MKYDLKKILSFIAIIVLVGQITIQTTSANYIYDNQKGLDAAYKFATDHGITPPNPKPRIFKPPLLHPKPNQKNQAGLDVLDQFASDHGIPATTKNIDHTEGLKLLNQFATDHGITIPKPSSTKTPRPYTPSTPSYTQSPRPYVPAKPVVNPPKYPERPEYPSQPPSYDDPCADYYYNPCYAADDLNPPSYDDSQQMSACNNHRYPRDIDGHWAEIYIRRLYDLCITEGYRDGFYRPQQNVTRAELTKMGLYGARIPAKTGCYDADCGTPFIDLDMWQGPYIRAAFDRQIVRGISHNRFAPNRAITRAEATKIILASFGYGPLSTQKSFFNDVRGWSIGWIEQAHELGIVQGIGNGNFDPNRPITRAEAAKIIAKTIEMEDTKIR